MKNLILVGGPMGVGKTATCRELQNILPKNVFLDGDWCWMMRPFTVTDETKQMVQQNIAYMLNSFLRCSEYENVIFCWVMHMQPIIDDILASLHPDGVNVHTISLIANEDALTKRIMGDVQAGIRTEDVLDRSLDYLPKYAALNTRKIDVSDISAAEAARQIADIVTGGEENR